MGQRQHRRYAYQLAESKNQTDGSLHLGFVRQTVGLYQPAPSPVGGAGERAFGVYCDFGCRLLLKFQVAFQTA